MPKKKRLKPNVEVITTLENGSTSKVTKTWNEAMSQLGHDGQIMVEHSYLHSNILMKESDRAAAILAPAYLDAILEELLRKVLLEGKSSDNLLDDQRPLGTFSSRIDIARSLQLIEDDAWHDLHLLRKTRNDFAHNVDVHTFSYGAVQDRCKEFKIPLRYSPRPQIEQAREKFLFVVWAIVGDISQAIKRASIERKKATE